MSPALTAAALWVLAATVTALLPMRYQVYSGLPLLLLAPVILVWIGLTQGFVWAGLGTFGFLSMFRRPLYFLGRRALGLPAFQPGDPQKGSE